MISIHGYYFLCLALVTYVFLLITWQYFSCAHSPCSLFVLLMLLCMVTFHFFQFIMFISCFLSAFWHDNVSFIPGCHACLLFSLCLLAWQHFISSNPSCLSLVFSLPSGMAMFYFFQFAMPFSPFLSIIQHGNIIIFIFRHALCIPALDCRHGSPLLHVFYHAIGEP